MASRSFRRFVKKELGRFSHFLIYAILEWIMIILLFIDGFLAFLCNEFTKFFELRIPCLLCTRIDHILVRRNPDFYYNDSICEAHKKDISSLAYCHVHRKLSDLRKMCEGCLLSFATEKESDCDMYKSLVGILHKDIDCFVEDDHRIFLKSGKKDDAVQVEKSSVHMCSCCGEPLKVRPSSKNYARSSSMNNGGARAQVYARSMSMNNGVPAPSPRAPTVTWRNEEGRNFELPHIRYTELNELEVPEDEDGPNANNHESREDIKAATIPLLADSEYLDFERERSYLLGILTDLEKKINLSPGEGDMFKHEDEDRGSNDLPEMAGQENEATLTREVSIIRERLRAIEADSGFLKHAAMTLQWGGEGTKLLTEIAQHLGKLRYSEKTDA